MRGRVQRVMEVEYCEGDKEQIGNKLLPKYNGLAAAPKLVQHAHGELGSVETWRHLYENGRECNKVLAFVEKPA